MNLAVPCYVNKNRAWKILVETSMLGMLIQSSLNAASRNLVCEIQKSNSKLQPNTLIYQKIKPRKTKSIPVIMERLMSIGDLCP